MLVPWQPRRTASGPDATGAVLREPEAAPIKAQAATSSLLEVSQGEFLGQKTAHCLPDERRTAVGECHVRRDFAGFVTSVTFPKRKEGDHQVALFVVPMARLLCW